MEKSKTNFPRIKKKKSLFTYNEFLPYDFIFHLINQSNVLTVELILFIKFDIKN